MGIEGSSWFSGNQIWLRHCAMRRLHRSFKWQCVRSCSLPVSAVKTSAVTTIEGLSENGDHPLQLAWDELDVPQCGYCQAGQIMTAAALLKKNPHPSSEEMDDAMHGNICRCGAYHRIREAVKSASTKKFNLCQLYIQPAEEIF